MSNNKHWQSFGDLNDTEQFLKLGNDEFVEELLPLENSNDSSLMSATPRRDFLKYLGFSTVAAAIAASCEMPIKKAIPFVNKPEDIVPGVADYYATTYVQDGDAVSIVVKVRDGRPIKIEGNELSPITKGGTSARVQASVLDLYDTARLRYPITSGNEDTFLSIDKSITTALNNLNGTPIVLLTGTINSPTTKEIINQFLAKHPGSRHVVYDAVSHTGMLLANEATYGKRAIPSYRFDKAQVIVSLCADFLGTWLSPVEFSKQYSKGKKINDAHKVMSKHIHFESMLSMTGANADDRYMHRPSEEGAVAVALFNALNGQSVTNIIDKNLQQAITTTAALLLEKKGASLVVSGSNDKNIQIIVNAINEILQSGGNTIDHSTTVNYKSGIDSDFEKLVEDMNTGAVGALLIHGANPAYTWYNSKGFIDGLKKVKLTVSFNPKEDETTQLCKYVIPDHHFLESWGDVELKTGYYSFIQPTIYPLFKTRAWQDSLLKWSTATTDYLNYIKAYWIKKLGGEMQWNKALQDGVVNPLESAALFVSFNPAAVNPAVTLVNSIKQCSGTELVLYQKVSVGVDGAANPWLQEMPDPITKATWDNYVMISPAMANFFLNIDLTKNRDADAYEVDAEKYLIKITSNNQSIELPALIIPGMQPDTVAIAIGYGRTEKIGKAAVNSGKNAFSLCSFTGESISFISTNITITKGEGKYPVAITQTHNIYKDNLGNNRTEVMKELTLRELIHKPNTVLEEREKELKPFGGVDKFEKEGTLYPQFDKPGIHWGMSVDLNSCTGCNACVIACNAENNIPVVGKHEVQRFHDMHWIRIDRYYSGDMNNPKVVFQPMMCQHCDNAPCENVCPVAATNHSSEGLNQMTYNRCIGTRYCANNCPFKVRRFNWADYTGADSFKHNQDEMSDVVLMMNDDITRMVLNPDVTVRSRGVIEKCSFCVQRLQEGKLKAKKESRPLNSGKNNEWDVKTACQQSCPTDAIIFGNISDGESSITQERKNNHNRLFHSLEQIHVLPNVNYLAKVRNSE